jgi:aryl-alcohol dehydrogenase-like predicted oxidoreductase
VKQVRLGKTELVVSRLALGGLFVSSVGAELAEAKRAVAKAVQLGINYIDTAPSYANSEEVLGKCLEEIGSPLVLSTKLGGRPDPFDPKDKSGLRQSVEESLRLLGRKRIDMLMIHEPERPGQYDWWTDRDTVEGPVLEVLDELRAEGVIKYIGLGGTTAYELARLMRSGKFDVVLTAFNYSLLYREAEHEILPAAAELGMGVVIGSPLQQGMFVRSFRDEIQRARFIAPPRKAQLEALYDLADETGMSLPEMAIRFPLANPAVHTILTGSRSAAEVELNVASVERGPLPSDIMGRIDEIASMVPFIPRDEPSSIGWIIGSPESWNGPNHV